MRKLAGAKMKKLSRASKKDMTRRNGSIDFCNVPSIKQAGEMSHECLITVLRLCPASEKFGSTRVILNTKTVSLREARRLVINMIRKVSIDLVEEIPEEPSSQS